MAKILQKIFSVKNEIGGKYKVVTILGLEFKFTNKYRTLYAKRFDGLTDEELKYVILEQYKKVHKRPANIKEPKTFNEKLTWEKIYYRNPLMTVCADKVKARDYYCEHVPNGEEHLVQQLGVYSSVDEIDFDSLPKEFVLKSNFGSGKQIIVKNKDELNIEETRKEISTWLDSKNNHYYDLFEYGYKDIPARIICEELLDFEYKLEIFCFYGQPKFFWIVLNDKTKHTQANFYNMDWSKIPVSNHYPNFTQEIKKPACYDELVENAKKMCGDFPFVRCDFYVTKDSYRFSEMTFYHWGAMEEFTPRKYDRIFGDMMTLPIG